MFRFGLTPAILLAASALPAQTKLNQFGNPPRLTPSPTSAAITVHDLQMRLYQFADDSMMGRQVGRIGNYKGTAYIAAEAKRLGMIPAGDNGTYFQVLPFHIKEFTTHSRLTVDGNPAGVGEGVRRCARDARAAPDRHRAGDLRRRRRRYDAADLGRAGRGKVRRAAARAVSSDARGRTRRQGAADSGAPVASRFADAVAVATVDLDAL